MPIQRGETVYPESLVPVLIAPCGMDCGLCSHHLRTKDRCAGCTTGDPAMPKYCTVCRIRNCDELARTGARFCSTACARFPCLRLRRLDARYRGRYGMSMIANLRSIEEGGVDAFVESERARWTCPQCGGVVCIHTPQCVYCGHIRS